MRGSGLFERFASNYSCVCSGCLWTGLKWTDEAGGEGGGRWTRSKGQEERLDDKSDSSDASLVIWMNFVLKKYKRKIIKQKNKKGMNEGEWIKEEEEIKFPHEISVQ